MPVDEDLAKANELLKEAKRLLLEEKAQECVGLVESDHEAVVKYDPAACEVDDLLKAVKNSKGMHPYSAKVKAE